MDHLHLTRLGRLAAFIGTSLIVWGFIGASVAPASAESGQARVLMGVCCSLHNEGPPTSGLVPADEEARQGELLPDVAWVGIALLLSAAAFGLGRILPRRSKEAWGDGAKRLWRAAAELALPEPERPCQWTCKAKVSPEALRRWWVKRIVLIPLPVPDAPEVEAKVVDDPKLLAALNDLAGLATVIGRASVVEDRLALLTHALVARVMAWSQEGCPPAAFRVDAEVAVPIKGRFELYQSRATRSGLTWDRPLLIWDDPVEQPTETTLGLFLGPRATELDFPGRIQEELGACLLSLARTARWIA